MIGLAVEAARSVLLPCSATIVVAAVLLALAGAGRARVVAATTVGLVVGAFVAAGWAPAVPAVVVGLGLAGGAVATRWAPRGPAPAGALVAGVAAGLLWQPCVGVRLGDTLTTAITRPWAALLPLAVYVVVLALPGVVTAWLVRPAREALATRVGGAAATLLVGLGALVVVGLGDDVTGALFRWSSAIS